MTAASTAPGSRGSFWRDEYELNTLIHRYPKPFVPIMDGIVMGGGIGLSGHASHRIVTEKSMLAMPETTIGLIPDVGGTWLLSRAPGATGVYLGLMGHRMNAADALYAGFADTMVETAKLPGLIEVLCRPGEPVSVAIAQVRERACPLASGRHRPEIDQAFRHDSVEAIRDALAAMPGDWAKKTLADFAPRSPLAMKTTLAADPARARA